MSNAVALRDRLASSLNKQVIIVNENGYYKVRIQVSPVIDQSVLEAMKDLMPSFGRLGLKEYWLMPVKTPPFVQPAEIQTIILPKAAVPPGSSVRVTEEKPVRLIETDKPPITGPGIALQVAIFHKESQALKAQRRIMSKLNLPVEIVKQFDYYHVIVTGFYSREETYEYYPELAGIGYPGITLIENYKSQK
jgi:hypothetical protein